MRNFLHFFDKLEDKIRNGLSRHPIVYSLIGGVAVVLFWRGVWMLADWLTMDLTNLESAVLSIIVSVATLLLIGLFVSFFVGDTILLSGIRREKKMFEKTEDEISKETNAIKDLKMEISKEAKVLEEIQKEVGQIKKKLDQEI